MTENGCGKAKILIIEDEPQVAAVTRKLLRRRFEADVDLAPDLATARELMASREYDMVTLDQMLPDGTGLDYLLEVRASGNRVPIVMLSAVLPASLEQDPMTCGALDYVVKDENLQSKLIQAATLGLGLVYA